MPKYLAVLLVVGTLTTCSRSAWSKPQARPTVKLDAREEEALFVALTQLMHLAAGGSGRTSTRSRQAHAIWQDSAALPVEAVFRFGRMKCDLARCLPIGMRLPSTSS